MSPVFTGNWFGANSADTQNRISERLFTTPGVTNFVVPDGVYSVSAVCVGGGGGGDGGRNTNGGGGGALSYVNNIVVTPGETLSVTVGIGGSGSSATKATDGDGGASRLARGATILCSAGGGGKGSGTRAGGTVGVGTGGDGGTGGTNSAGGTSGGGGGAGGYSGKGGNGGSNGNQDGSIGASGSGAAGGGGSGDTYGGSGGGGVGLSGKGSIGFGGFVDSLGIGGWGGSDGTDGSTGSTFTAGGSSYYGGNGGLYGGGGGGSGDTSGIGGTGGNGAVKIVWGLDRTYPSSVIIDLGPYPPSIRSTSQSTTANTITLGTVQSGDTIVLFAQKGGADISATAPSGFTQRARTVGNDPRIAVYTKVATGTETTITGDWSVAASMVVDGSYYGIGTNQSGSLATSTSTAPGDNLTQRSLVAFWTVCTNNETVITPPVDWTQREYVNGSSREGYLYTKEYLGTYQPATGNTGDVTAVWSGTVGPTNSILVTLVP